MTQEKDLSKNPLGAPISQKTTPQKTLAEQQAQIQRMRSTKIYDGMRTEDGDYKVRLKPIVKIIR